MPAVTMSSSRIRNQMLLSKTAGVSSGSELLMPELKGREIHVVQSQVRSEAWSATGIVQLPLREYRTGRPRCALGGGGLCIRGSFAAVAMICVMHRTLRPLRLQYGMPMCKLTGSLSPSKEKSNGADVVEHCGPGQHLHPPVQLPA